MKYAKEVIKHTSQEKLKKPVRKEKNKHIRTVLDRLSGYLEALT